MRIKYLNSNKIIKIINEYNLSSKDKENLINYISELNSEDVKPIIHGEWIAKKNWDSAENNDSKPFKCSNCGFRTSRKKINSYYYCPKCGAELIGRIKDENIMSWEEYKKTLNNNDDEE